MKRNKGFIPFLIISIILLSACGKKKEISQAKAIYPKTVTEPKTVEEEAEETAPSVILYTVILSGKALSLYEVNGENKKLITSIEINPEFYPKEDVEKLKRGIEAYCKEDGYEILENFAN